MDNSIKVSSTTTSLNGNEKARSVKMTGADAVIHCLKNEDVNLVFGYPGGAIMPIYDSLHKYQDEVRHILTRHEQGAIHAAQGLARVTGKVGVVMATSGPGATNLITGIADAMIDSTPLVCVTGQVGSHLLGTDAFQETDVVGISMPVTKWNYQITSPEEIPDAFAKAFYIARSGRPGPVVLDITKNAQFAEFDYYYKPCKHIRSYLPSPKIDQTRIEEAVELINNAKKPLALVGQGVILGSAEQELLNFLEKTGIPAAWTLLGLSAMPTDHPNNVGMLGMHGNYGPNIKTNECDVLIAIGMRFDDRVTGALDKYAKQAKIIHLELDPAEINKNVYAHVPVLGNVKESLPMLTAKAQQKSYDAWFNEFKEADKIEFEKVIDREMHPVKEGLTMAETIDILNKKTGGDAIIVTDVGQHQMVASRYARFVKSRSNVTSGGLGTMGFALPAAIGAKLGQPDREVICVVGDGGLQMTIQELGTILQSEVGVKIVLLNNSFLGMVRQWQELFFDSRYAQTIMANPDFIKIAEGFGIKSKKVLHRPELSTAIDEMYAHKGAYFLEVVVEKEDNVFPMIPTGAAVSDILLGK
ncbi:MAG: biosynthetic-type acetolactate synthase large subunit [Bacteroidetes bacterium]|jgi:acetolactate synthase-1/2/3 large subunit|nr:biosynthetic-type acetolactate synthase large subunit [Bacteroidota bacterium]